MGKNDDLINKYQPGQTQETDKTISPEKTGEIEQKGQKWTERIEKERADNSHNTGWARDKNIGNTIENSYTVENQSNSYKQILEKHGQSIEEKQQPEQEVGKNKDLEPEQE